MVELVDLYPTLCELTGLGAPRKTQGESLAPILRDPAATVKSGAISFTRAGHSWRTKDWAYMRYRDGSEELYDMKNDPGQITNLTGDPQYAANLKQMADGLDSRIKRAAPNSGSH
jgi:iduronate 2-sulfatase